MARRLPMDPSEVMRRLRPRYDAVYQMDQPLVGDPRRVHVENNLEFLVAHTEEDSPYILNTSLALCAQATRDNPEQCVSYYLSILCCIFPGIQPLVRDYFSERGYGLTQLTRAELINNEIEVMEWINSAKCYVVFGQMVLIMYKNIMPQNYEPFFQNRTSAMKAEAGVFGNLNPNGGDVLLSIGTAEMIHDQVQRANELRSGVLKILLLNRSARTLLGNVCNYLCEIIKWSEMSGIVWIWEHLCLPRACVLANNQVQHEVINIYEACFAIASKEYPEYYRVFHPLEAVRTISRSRFPILQEVARRIKNKQFSPAGQFQHAITETASPLVVELFNLYENDIILRNQPRLTNVLNLLTNFDAPIYQPPPVVTQPDQNLVNPQP